MYRTRVLRFPTSHLWQFNHSHYSRIMNCVPGSVLGLGTQAGSHSTCPQKFLGCLVVTGSKLSLDLQQQVPTKATFPPPLSPCLQVTALGTVTGVYSRGD